MESQSNHIQLLHKSKQPTNPKENTATANPEKIPQIIDI
jgi:hypothetical protein